MSFHLVPEMTSLVILMSIIYITILNLIIDRKPMLKNSEYIEKMLKMSFYPNAVNKSCDIKI